MNPQDLNHWIAAISGAAALAFTVLRWVLPWSRKVIKDIKALVAALTTLDAIVVTLAKIEHEVLPNNGGSMRDEIRALGRDSRMQGARIDAIMDFGPSAIFEADETGKYVLINATFQLWLGRATKNLLGNGWLTSVDADDRERVRGEWFAAVRDQREYRNHYAMVSDSGMRIDVECTARPITDPSTGDLLRYHGQIRRQPLTNFVSEDAE